jgi:hypothetical protein
LLARLDLRAIFNAFRECSPPETARPKIFLSDADREIPIREGLKAKPDGLIERIAEIVRLVLQAQRFTSLPNCVLV